MPYVTMPDGKVVDMPDNPDPKLIAEIELLSSGSTPIKAPGRGAESGKDLFLRRLGLLGRGAATAATGTVGLAGDALNTIINKTTGTNLRMPSEVIQNTMTGLGVPEPETPDEHLAVIGTSLAGGKLDPAIKAASRVRRPVMPDHHADTIRAAQDLGYRFPPTTAKSGTTGRIVEGMAGGKKLREMLREKNQIVTDRILREQAGLPEGVPLMDDIVKGAISDTYTSGYEPVKQIGQVPAMPKFRQTMRDLTQEQRDFMRSFPEAVDNEVLQAIRAHNVPAFDTKHAVKEIANLRSQASDAYRSGHADRGATLNKVAKALEDNIDEYLQAQQNLGTLHASKRGGTLTAKTASQTLDDYRGARKQIAKQEVVKRSIVPGAGSGSALHVGAELKGKAPLTGDLRTVGEAANIAGDSMSYPRVDPTMFTGFENATQLGAGTALLMNPSPGALATFGLPFSRAGLRHFLASKAGQKLFAQPARQKATPNELLLRAPAAYNLGSGLYGQDDE